MKNIATNIENKIKASTLRAIAQRAAYGNDVIGRPVPAGILTYREIKQAINYGQARAQSITTSPIRG